MLKSYETSKGYSIYARCAQVFTIFFTYGDVEFQSVFSVHSVSRVQQRDRPEGLPGNHHVRSGYHVHTF